MSERSGEESTGRRQGPGPNPLWAINAGMAAFFLLAAIILFGGST